MKKHLFLILILLPCLLSAKSRTILKYGIVQTNFRHQVSQSISRHSFAISREYFPMDNNHFFFSYDFMVARKSVLLSNRTWTVYYDDPNTLGKGDVKVDVSFIELPIKFGYTLSLFPKWIHLQIFLGSALSMPVYDFSRLITRDVRHLSRKDRTQFVYSSLDEASSNNSFNSIFGTAIEYKFIGFELYYSRALGETSNVNGMTIVDYFDCWQFMLRLSF